MAKSLVQSNAREFVKSLDKVSQMINKEIMSELAIHIDNIRFRAATEEILPKRGKEFYDSPDPNSKRKRLWGFVINPTHLTGRTGKLQNILKSRGSWSGTGTRIRLNADPHVICWVSPQAVGGRVQYMARLSVVGGGDSEIEYRLQHETNGSRRLHIRRPFLEPVYNKEAQAIQTGLQNIVGLVRTV